MRMSHKKRTDNLRHLAKESVKFLNEIDRPVWFQVDQKENDIKNRVQENKRQTKTVENRVWAKQKYKKTYQNPIPSSWDNKSLESIELKIIEMLSEIELN